MGDLEGVRGFLEGLGRLCCILEGSGESRGRASLDLGPPEGRRISCILVYATALAAREGEGVGRVVVDVEGMKSDR